MSKNKLENRSADAKYFIITPQLVWALSRDAYDFSLWNVVKMIAGDDGECYLHSDDLAALAMMSTGKMSDCRLYLIESGLLEGEIRKDPEYPQPVWHLRVPDLWSRNLAWRKVLGDKLTDRIAYKRRQKAELKKVSPGETSEKVSPGEKGLTPGERGLTPGETKNNQKENQKGKPGLVLWDEVMDQINLMGDHAGLLDNARVVDYDDDTLTISLGSTEAVDWCEHRDRRRVERALYAVTNGAPPSLVFTINDNGAHISMGDSST